MFYCRSKPLHLGFFPAVQIRQVSQRSVFRWEGAVQKQPPSAAAAVFQLGIVLVVELDRVGGAPLAAILVSQVDDRGAISRFRHVDESLQIFSRKTKWEKSKSNLKCKSCVSETDGDNYLQDCSSQLTREVTWKCLVWSLQQTVHHLYTQCLT